MAYQFPLEGGRINASVGGNSTSAGAGYSLISTGTLLLAGGNNITLSQNGSAITISGANAPSGSINFSASNTSANLASVTFSNSNGVSFGLNAGVITASHNALTSQSNQALSASNGSFAFQTAGFSNANGVTFGTSAGSIMTASVNTSYAASNHTHGNPTLNLTNISGTTASASNGLTLSLSAAAQSAQTQSNIQGIVASGSTNRTGDISFANSNGVTFGLSNNTITASVAAGGGGGVALANSQTTYTSGTVNLLEGGGAITIASTTGQKYNFSVPAQSSLSVTGALSISRNASTISIGAPAFSAGISNIGNTSGTSGTASNQVIFAGGNNITLSQSTGAGGNTISIIGGAGGGGGVALYDGVNSISSGTARVSVGGALTASVNGQTLSLNAPGTSSLIGTNGISLSTTSNSIFVDGAALGGLTLSYFNPQDAYMQVTGVHGNGTLHIQPVQAPNVQFDRIAMPIYYTNASNSTASVSLSVSIGFYTRNSSTLSLASSVSTSGAWVGSGTVNSASYNGIRLLTIGATTSLSQGQYYVGIASSSATGGNNATLQQIVASQQNSSFSGIFGLASNTSNQYTRGLGYYSATVSTLPNSVGINQIRGGSSMALRQPFFYLVSQTF